jgi:hypothetical protein
MLNKADKYESAFYGRSIKWRHQFYLNPWSYVKLPVNMNVERTLANYNFKDRTKGGKKPKDTMGNQKQRRKMS